ncbi:MAG: hypothetical protein WBR10_12850 [Candidatus Acidiferrum sp.]
MRVHVDSKPAMTMHRRILTKDRIVYLLVGKNAFKYKGGRSHIAYIGTSKRGARRIASSAAQRADKVFSKWGSKHMDVFIASCSAKPGLKSWMYLERALLAQFLAWYRELPFCNKQGKKYKFDEKMMRMFKQKRIHRILMRFAG